MQVLRQSTQVKVRIGPFVDVGDGFTPETGITLGSADEAELLKADGAATVSLAAATWAAISGADGYFDLTLTTSHTDTVGTLEVVVQDDSVCLPVLARFQVITADAYDALYASDARLGRSAMGIVLGTATTGGTTTSIPTSSLDPSATATDQFKGRVVIFDKDTTTAALRGQATDITASTSGGTLTVTALSTAPVNGDTFTIV